MCVMQEVNIEAGKLVLQGSGKGFEEILSKEKIPYVKKERKLYQKTIGFRSNKLWKKIAASLVYLSVFFLIIMFSFGDSSSDSESIDVADEVAATSTNDKQEVEKEAEEQQEQDEEAARVAEEQRQQEEAVRAAAEQQKQEEAAAAAATETQASNVYYKNCSAVRAAGAAPIRVGESGYSRKLDRDGDGIGCEV